MYTTDTGAYPSPTRATAPPEHTGTSAAQHRAAQARRSAGSRLSGCGDPATDSFHSRLRVTLSAAHEEADIHALVAVLSKPMPTRTRTRTGLLDPTIDSKWRNQLNPPSTLTIANIDSKTGEITGTYESPSGTKGATYSLVGWVNSAPPSGTANNVPVIAFSVRWNGYGSIASWTGYCEDREGTPTISALWHLVRSNSQFSWDPC